MEGYIIKGKYKKKEIIFEDKGKNLYICLEDEKIILNNNIEKIGIEGKVQGNTKQNDQMISRMFILSKQ